VQRFYNHGARLEEQIELMRRLWTEPSLSFEGQYEHVTGAGIRPLPVQRRIPVWIGGSVDAALARAGRLADGCEDHLAVLSATAEALTLRAVR
jgi:alkanesulfonate monooxygenase SsuD/methylene tetrahydromethanopterin reductase-like flavin-dependent oxidoreductase (luciferase family)